MAFVVVVWPLVGVEGRIKYVRRQDRRRHIIRVNILKGTYIRTKLPNNIKLLAFDWRAAGRGIEILIWWDGCRFIGDGYVMTINQRAGSVTTVRKDPPKQFDIHFRLIFCYGSDVFSDSPHHVHVQNF